ncbi:MAG: hypothetical protein IJH17_04715 [Clostridia bacterium]|nr:hypothetical protein [Clostridia bacterium]
MPNLTTALPRRTGNIEEDYDRLYNWAVSLTDELKSLLCNLDSGNVTEAGSIKAQNIDASQAKIKDAQIASLTADKLTAGTIDTEKITVKGTDENGRTMLMTGEKIVFTETVGGRTYERIVIGNNNGNYIFTVQNRGGTQGIYMTSNGEMQLTGDINTGKDCRVQGQLLVGNGTDASSYKGIAFYCKNYFNPSDGYCGGIFPYVIAYSEGSPVTGGICVDTSLYAKSGYGTYSKVVTFDDLQNQSNNT